MLTNDMSNPPLRPPPPPTPKHRYADRLPGKPIILLTNDAANRAAAAALGLNAMSLTAYARSRTDVPELIDLVARQVGACGGGEGEGGGGRAFAYRPRGATGGGFGVCVCVRVRLRFWGGGRQGADVPELMDLVAQQVEACCGWGGGGRNVGVRGGECAQRWCVWGGGS